MPGKRRANQIPTDYEPRFNPPDYERLRLSPVVDDSSLSSEFELGREYAIPPTENIPPQEEKKSRGAMRTLEETSDQLDHMLATVSRLQEQPEAMNELSQALDAELVTLQTRIGTLAQKLVKVSEKMGQRACFHEPAPTP